MSTQEPGGPQPEGGTPGLAQPQDPWAGGFEYGHGQASMPTDPHGPTYDPYSTYGQDLWNSSQETQAAAPGWNPQQPVTAPPAPPKSRAVPVLVALLVVVVLGAGAGAIWWFTNGPGSTAGGTTTPSANPTASGTKAPDFDPHPVKAGQCLRNEGTDSTPKMKVAPCEKDAYKILKRLDGVDIPENNEGKFDQYTAAKACAGVKDYKMYYAFDSKDDSQDLVFCMGLVE